MTTPVPTSGWCWWIMVKTAGAATEKRPCGSYHVARALLAQPEPIALAAGAATTGVEVGALAVAAARVALVDALTSVAGVELVASAVPRPAATVATTIVRCCAALAAGGAVVGAGGGVKHRARACSNACWM